MLPPSNQKFSLSKKRMLKQKILTLQKLSKQKEEQKEEQDHEQLITVETKGYLMPRSGS